MKIENIGEEFFLKSINVEHVFQIIERTDYLFLYNIKKCMKNPESQNRVYLYELAEQMQMSVTDISKAVKSLEEKGFVTWELDENKEKTYITLTNKAIELAGDQKKKMITAYEKVKSKIQKEDLETTVATLNKIRKLLNEII